MKYIALLEQEAHDIMLNFLKAQERDHYSHSINKKRYEKMLETLPAGKFRDRVEHLLAETKERIEEVEAIIVATLHDLPGKDQIEQSLERLKAKEEAAK